MLAFTEKNIITIVFHCKCKELYVDFNNLKGYINVMDN